MPATPEQNRAAAQPRSGGPAGGSPSRPAGTGPADVAIGGRMRVGKTTCAEHLVTRHGYRRRALADPIKGVAREGFDWDGRKDARGRRLLQDLGTAGRVYDPAIWLRRFDAWLAAHREVPVVVDDVRLLAEIEHFRRLGFVTIVVLRPGAADLARAEEGWLPAANATAGDPLRAHDTETEIDRARPDVTLVNDGSVADLHRKLDLALEPWLAAHGRERRPG